MAEQDTIANHTINRIVGGVYVNLILYRVAVSVPVRFAGEIGTRVCPFRRPPMSRITRRRSRSPRVIHVFKVFVSLSCVDTGQILAEELVSLASLTAAEEHLRDSIRRFSEENRDTEALIEYWIKRMRIHIDESDREMLH